MCIYIQTHANAYSWTICVCSGLRSSVKICCNARWLKHTHNHNPTNTHSLAFLPWITLSHTLPLSLSLTRTNMRIHTRTKTHTHAHVHIITRVRTHTHASTYTHTYTHICKNTSVHTYIYTYMRTHTQAHAHTCDTHTQTIILNNALSNTLHNIASNCKMLQHATTHYNTLQHIEQAVVRLACHQCFAGPNTQNLQL